MKDTDLALYERQVDFIVNLFEFHEMELLAILSPDEEHLLRSYLFMGRTRIDENLVDHYRQMLTQVPEAPARTNKILERIADRFEIEPRFRDFLQASPDSD